VPGLANSSRQEKEDYSDGERAEFERSHEEYYYPKVIKTMLQRMEIPAHVRRLYWAVNNTVSFGVEAPTGELLSFEFVNVQNPEDVGKELAEILRRPETLA